MAEYIERDATLAFQDELEPLCLANPMTGDLFCTTKDSDLVAFLQKIPAADVAPVVHARWQATEAYPHNVYCTHCYKIYAQTHWTVWEDGSLPRDFCPACGARMDGVSNA